jgi:hypothetical protein
MTEQQLINRVSQSGLITINLEKWYPTKEIEIFDLKPHLYMGMVVKEKEFRENLKNHDWMQYQDKVVLVICSAQTILPIWAKMLVATFLEGTASEIFFGDLDSYLKVYYKTYIDNLDLTIYENQRIVIKGCGEKQISDDTFAYFTLKLKPVAKSILFGEACSNVPIYKNKS